jgi:hypothetical protein
MQNITSALSFSTDFVLKCTTSAEDATTSFGVKYKGLEQLDKLLLAFLMNLVGKVQTIYNTFTSITQASADCDYYLVSRRMGQLFKALTGFSADLLGVTLMSSNGDSISNKLRQSTTVMSNKLYRVRPPLVKSTTRVVAETVFKHALEIFENLAQQAIEDKKIFNKKSKGPLEQLDDIFA